jgi:hypothetical protein
MHKLSADARGEARKFSTGNCSDSQAPLGFSAGLAQVVPSPMDHSGLSSRRSVLGGNVAKLGKHAAFSDVAPP